MPANKKHLTKSPWLKLAKILTGAIGGYTVMITFHLLLGKIFPPENVVTTSFFTGYILWAVLLLVAFLDKSVLRISSIYLALTLVFTGAYLFV
jgi:hypothetical protein